MGAGIELVPIQHPNDLYAGETAKFRFLLDGKPAKDLEVEDHRGRHALSRRAGEMTFKTDKDGEVAITWPAAGIYWLDVSVQDEKRHGAQREEAPCDATTPRFEVLHAVV